MYTHHTCVHSRLDHDYIVKYYDSFQTADERFLGIRMGLCPKGTLEDQLGKLPVRRIRLYLGQLASAFVYLQQQRVIHRDLKLNNVCIDGTGQLRVVDLGLATLGPPAAGSSLGSLGAPSTHTLTQPRGQDVYLSPESLKPGVAISYPHDMWMLGLMLVELLTGKTIQELLSMHRPYPACDSVFATKLKKAKAAAVKVDEPLGRIAHDLLQPSSSNRLTAVEVLQRLRQIGMSAVGKRVVAQAFDMVVTPAWVAEVCAA